MLFVIPLAVGVLAQLSKAFVNKNWLTEGKIHGHRLPRYGGMPSAHTAFAFSLATLALFAEGVNSFSFAIASAIVIFLLDDALRMRVYLSRHGEAIQKLITKLPENEQKDLPHLEQRLGHTPAEVIVGAIIGVVATALLYKLFV